jgi:ribosomal-protein-alanine N-acetyltransferase
MQNSSSETIATARLYLRPFTPDDLDALARIYSDPAVMKYIRGGKPFSLAQTKDSLHYYIMHRKAYGFGLWAAVHKEHGI